MSRVSFLSPIDVERGTHFFRNTYEITAAVARVLPTSDEERGTKTTATTSYWYRTPMLDAENDGRLGGGACFLFSAGGVTL